MKANAGVVITGERVTLVPYEKEHVPKYHNWMKDPWLQEMTASEPLSIEEEFEMQKAWRDDAEKCTFIVLARAEGDAEPGASYVDESAVERMAGDVNLFFNDYDDPHACEMEIMIAEEKYRRKGFAEEAVKLMMAYATSKLNVTRFFCKIIETNSASVKLFEKLGYVKYANVAAFKQVELELVTKDKQSELVDAVLKSATIHPPQ
ncbi:n-acetyltransferase 9 [Phytophthora cinnamomi]|uniref:n-acetyltransferase 9 n=1 Tax=Phytophthora cinnamomi TaxID=4785 RepID=UPI00355968A6|nr:n-acetyltransferase 9 [Phytophthora cinnamomi]